MTDPLAVPHDDAGVPSGAITDEALRCRGLTKSYATPEGDVLAVDAVDFHVPTGSLTALLGPSGCGKTTVLRLLAGLEAPDAGSIEVHGTVVAAGRPRPVLVPAEQRNVGLVFQDYALFPHLTVADNVAYGLRRLERTARRARVAEALELVELTAEADRRPGALSGGQQQRVAIARALAPRPALLLLDEPFSNLDASMRATVRGDVRRILHDAGISSLIVTHDQEEALSLADRVGVMSEGRLHQLDTPLDLYRSPATSFVAGFVGDADVIAARPAGPGRVHTALGELQTHGDARDAALVMVRPEHLDVMLAPEAEDAARITDIQFFGHDQLLTLQLPDGTHVRSRRGPNVVLHVGDRVRAVLDGRVRVFDADGRASTSRSATAVA